MKRRLLREHHGENYEQAILSFPTGDLWPPPPSFFSFQHFLNFPAIAVFLKYPRGKTLELTFTCDSFLPNSSHYCCYDGGNTLGGKIPVQRLANGQVTFSCPTSGSMYSGRQ
jgi:hypothetical protein